MAREMTKTEAEQIIGISGEYDLEKLKSVRKDYLKKYHPDVAKGMSFKEANDALAKVNSAYRVLKKQFDNSPSGKTVISSVRENNVGKKNIRQEKTGSTLKQDSPASTAAQKPKSSQESLKQENQEKEKEAERQQRMERRRDIAEIIVAFIPFAWILGILSWTLPFYIFGGLNIFPFWKGIIEPDGMQFLFAYFIIPAFGAWCFLYSPVINEFLRELIPELVTRPPEAIRTVLFMIGAWLEEAAEGAKQEAKQKASEAAQKVSDMPNQAKNNQSSTSKPPSPSGKAGAGQRPNSPSRPSPAAGNNRPPRPPRQN